MGFAHGGLSIGWRRRCLRARGEAQERNAEAGGNGGGAVTGTVGVSVGIGRRGGGGGAGDAVTFDGTTSSVTTSGKDSAGILVQSVGGGGGNGGYAVAVSAIVSVGIGGNGGAAGKGGIVDARSNGRVETFEDRSAGIVVQSIGGGGGNGGSGFGVFFAQGSNGGNGGDGSIVEVFSNLNLTTSGADSHGI